MTKNAKPWIAIISFPHPDKMRPYVLQDEQLENLATFRSPAAIEKVMMNHILVQGVWTAFNYETGETECLG
jgi:hypothetical protein